MSETTKRRGGLPGGSASVGDKRFRRPDVRPGRGKRFSQRIWRYTALGLGLAALVVVGAMASTSVVNARLLAVDDVDVQGNRRLSIGEINQLIAGVRGQSLLLVDLQQFRARLLESRWVASVTIRRILPSTIAVRIVERDPVAVARLGQQLYLVDDSGVIIDAYGPQYSDFDLPIVDGMGSTTDGKQPGIDPARAQLASRFLSALAIRPELRQSVSQVDVSRADNVAVLLNDDPTLLYLGNDQFMERLRTYLEIRSTLAERLHDVDWLDLRFGPRVIAKERKDRTQRQ